MTYTSHESEENRQYNGEKRQTMTYTSHESEKNRQYNGEKRQTMTYTTLHIKLKIGNLNPIKIRGRRIKLSTFLFSSYLKLSIYTNV
jgi:hypothetical protein